MVRALHARRFDPSRMTFVVGGDLTGIDVARLAAARFGGWSPTAATQAETTGAIDDRPAERHRRIVVVHRPGSVQTEIRVGHPGLPRRIAGYHAVVIMAAILGGLFNSRLNRRLREEKGYTYGAAASFDFRRAAGPFAARAAVDTAVTVPALVDMLAELVAIGERRVTDDELRVARDYLVGVFPLRFETPGAVVGALTGLAVHGLDEGELVRYRAAVEAVTADDVQAAARAHVRPDEAAIVLVGDADAFLPALEAAGLGSVTVQREPVEMMAGAADGEPGPEPDGGAGAE
jgi:predicted Zn-dependent peptidase